MRNLIKCVAVIAAIASVQANDIDDREMTQIGNIPCVTMGAPSVITDEQSNVQDDIEEAFVRAPLIVRAKQKFMHIVRNNRTLCVTGSIIVGGSITLSTLLVLYVTGVVE